MREVGAWMQTMYLKTSCIPFLRQDLEDGDGDATMSIGDIQTSYRWLRVLGVENAIGQVRDIGHTKVAEAEE
ncbi:uncharacterized protein PADG_11748 [Paracoccidioides brasiliensis Pb18]|uniref:Uncharacterized protein n=1 Tax=Paracoccidioides brasiliensis (strain Pb18) TaxID=502780 RepID=A0A0A0HXZ1_PARBD|nr:uncharacterized protein PADG_11748 [Paracoccidioides brasiliensis Pb18]KGM92210.1 hypothetical protein PADG_11748 [Paracoccidioides brasiliensis Pb18]